MSSKSEHNSSKIGFLQLIEIFWRAKSIVSEFAQSFAHRFRRILCACVMALQAAEFWSRYGDAKEGQI